MTFPVAMAFMAALHWPTCLIVAAIVAGLGVWLGGAWRVVGLVLAGLLVALVVLGGGMLAGF